jgi:hypothetical protein
VNIPANTTGWLGPDAAKYKLDGVALNENRQLKAATRDGQEGFEVPAGSYTFDVELQ